jgi:hypothetical protein
MKHLKTALVLGILLLLSCTAIQSNKDTVASQVDMINWKTAGGGEAEFRIVQKDGIYSIQVNSWSFKALNVKVMVTAGDKEVIEILSGIFSGKINLKEEQIEPKGPTGTWTTISLFYKNGTSSEYGNINLFGKSRLSLIYDFVKSSLPASAKN